jgi:hypothetical protein
VTITAHRLYRRKEKTVPKQSIADLVVAWEMLVTNVRASGGDVPGVDLYTPPMEEILAQAKDLSARLEMRRGVKQQESKERRLLMQKGKKQAARLRAALKAYFGVDSERLIEFGARPIRPRTRKNQETADPPPPEIEAGAGADGPES